LNSAHGARVCAALPWRMPNFVLLHTGRPEIAHLLTAMLQAREAVGRRSWSHPQEPTGEDWWADSWLTHEPENEIGVSTYRQGHLRRSWPGGYLSQDISAHSLKDGLHTLICVFDRILRPKAEVDCKSRSVDALLATAFGAHRRSSTTRLFEFVGTVGVSASAGRWCECCARSLSRSARCRRTMRGSGGSKTSTERRTGR
jgi:hypothetical protein